MMMSNVATGSRATPKILRGATVFCNNRAVVYDVRRAVSRRHVSETWSASWPAALSV